MDSRRRERGGRSLCGTKCRRVPRVETRRSAHAADRVFGVAARAGGRPAFQTNHKGVEHEHDFGRTGQRAERRHEHGPVRRAGPPLPVRDRRLRLPVLRRQARQPGEVVYDADPGALAGAREVTRPKPPAATSSRSRSSKARATASTTFVRNINDGDKRGMDGYKDEPTVKTELDALTKAWAALQTDATKILGNQRSCSAPRPARRTSPTSCPR